MSLATLFRKAAVANGVTVRNDSVTGIGAGDRIDAIALASGDRITCNSLVNAAGAWAGELSALAGVRLPVEPRKRYVYVLDCREASEAQHWAPLTVDPSGVWFRPEGRFFLCGKSPEAARSRRSATWTRSTTPSSSRRSGRGSPRACRPSTA